MEGQPKWLIRLVAIVWTMNLVAGMLPWLHYQPNESVNGVFGLIIGGLFVTEKRKAPEPPREAPADVKEPQ